MEGDFQKAEEIVNKEISDERANMESCNNLMETMQNDPDPKFRNSRFLHFIQQVNKGNYEIKDNELVKHKEEPLETVDENSKLGIKHWTEARINEDIDIIDDLDEAFKESEMVVNNELQANGRLTEAYNEAEMITEKDQVKLDMMGQEWQKAETKVEEEMIQENKDTQEAHMNKMETFWEKAMQDYNPEDPQMLEK